MTRTALRNEVARFKRWASAQSVPVERRHGEWEVDYGEWPALHDAALAFLASTAPDMWTDEDASDLLYVIARDNEIEHLSRALSRQPDALLKLSSFAASSSESDAKWQLASQLGTLTERRPDAERLLLAFVEDDDEYVSRHALLALGALRSSHVERLAERAWETGRLYQRIAALHVLAAARSTKLERYLDMAEDDGREHLVNAAAKHRVR